MRRRPILGAGQTHVWQIDPGFTLSRTTFLGFTTTILSHPNPTLAGELPIRHSRGSSVSALQLLLKETNPVGNCNKAVHPIARVEAPFCRAFSIHGGELRTGHGLASA